MKKGIDRSTIIFACTLILGILAIAVMQFSGENEVVQIKISSTTGVQNGIYDKLKKEIESLKSGSFNPNRFNIIEGSVQGYYAEEMITEPAANVLKAEIKKIFEAQVYSKCEMFLKNGTGNSAQVKQWLSMLESKIGPNNKINTYRQQINWYQYYSITLPKKVKGFVQSGIGNYEDSRYQNLKNEVQNMPGLSPAYKSIPKFKSISSSLMTDLYQFNYEYNN